MTEAGDRPAASTWAARAPSLAALFGILVVAWSPRLVPGFFATDDLAFMNVEASPETMLRQGRPGQAALYGLFQALGAHPVHSGTLLNWVALGLLALTSWWLLRLWRVPPSPLPVLCAALVFVHPNLAETFSFRFTPVFFAVAIALAVAGLLLARDGAPLRGGLLIAASFTVYQVTFNTLLTVLALGVVLDCVRGERTVRGVLGDWIRPAAAVGAAALAALVLQRATAAALGASVQGERARFLPLDALPGRLAALGAVFRRVLGADPVLSTRALAVLQGVLLGAALGAALLPLARRRRWGQAALVVAGLAVALGGVVGVVALLAEFWPSPRVLTAAGVFWAGVLLVLALTVERRGRWLVGLAAATLMLGYAGIDHRVASDQVRLNLRDLSLASRIVGRLESLPGWRTVERVAILGAPRAVPGIPQEFDVNPSALSVPWSQAMLLREVTDRRLANPSAAELQRAERRCAAVEGWPAADSVWIDGPLAIVCLKAASGGTTAPPLR